jgi:hypothetical protein
MDPTGRRRRQFQRRFDFPCNCVPLLHAPDKLVLEFVEAFLKVLLASVIQQEELQDWSALNQSTRNDGVRASVVGDLLKVPALR